MNSKTLTGIVLILALVLAAVQPARATETENLGLHPARPGRHQG